MSQNIWFILPKTGALVICLRKESEKRGGRKGKEKVGDGGEERREGWDGERREER